MKKNTICFNKRLIIILSLLVFLSSAIFIIASLSKKPLTYQSKAYEVIETEKQGSDDITYTSFIAHMTNTYDPVIKKWDLDVGNPIYVFPENPEILIHTNTDYAFVLSSSKPSFNRLMRDFDYTIEVVEDKGNTIQIDRSTFGERIPERKFDDTIKKKIRFLSGGNATLKIQVYRTDRMDAEDYVDQLRIPLAVVSDRKPVKISDPLTMNTYFKQICREDDQYKINFRSAFSIKYLSEIPSRISTCDPKIGFFWKATNPNEIFVSTLFPGCIKELGICLCDRLYYDNLSDACK